MVGPTIGFVRRLEFWPDYGGQLLHERGAPVSLDVLGLAPAIVDQARGWLEHYDDARLDPSNRDDAWIAEGRALFVRLEAALQSAGIELTDWEGYWAEVP
jgi:hypothetical protein